MKNTKRVIRSLPEYYLAVLILLAGYRPPASINPFAIALVTILILQIIFRNDLCGVIIAGLFILVNVLMLMALISEFSEFKTFNSDAMQLLLGGLFLFVLNLVASLLMIRRYAWEHHPAYGDGFR